MQSPVNTANGHILKSVIISPVNTATQNACNLSILLTLSNLSLILYCF